MNGAKRSERGKRYEKIFNIFISNVYDNILDSKNNSNINVTNGKRLYGNGTNERNI